LRGRAVGSGFLKLADCAVRFAWTRVFLFVFVSVYFYFLKKQKESIRHYQKKNTSHFKRAQVKSLQDKMAGKLPSIFDVQQQAAAKAQQLQDELHRNARATASLQEALERLQRAGGSSTYATTQELTKVPVASCGEDGMNKKRGFGG
jgi:uncharacterized membrane protein YhiD involved in acid resistance